MAKRLLLRDAENLSADMLQRMLGSALAVLTGPSGIGSGYALGGVGKINPSWNGASLPTGHLVVQANGSSLQLTITPGWAALQRDAGGSTYDPRALFAESDANDSSVTLSANATGSTRNDTVCLKIDMATAPTSDGSNLISFAAIAGQSGGGVSNAPADGNLYLPLANVAVANGAPSVSQANVTDKRLWLPATALPFKARAFLNANQSLVTATWTKAALNASSFDVNANFSTSTNLYSVPVAGYYLIMGQHQTAATTGRVGCRINKNSGTILAQSLIPPHASGNTTCQVADVQLLAQGDTIGVDYYQESGGNANALSGTGMSFFVITLVNPL